MFHKGLVNPIADNLSSGKLGNLWKYCCVKVISQADRLEIAKFDFPTYRIRKVNKILSK